MVDAKQQEINIGTLARGQKLTSQPYFFRCWSRGSRSESHPSPSPIHAGHWGGTLSRQNPSVAGKIALMGFFVPLRPKPHLREGGFPSGGQHG